MFSREREIPVGHPDWDPYTCPHCAKFMHATNVETFAVEVAEEQGGEAHDLLLRFMRLYHRNHHLVPR